MMTRARIDAGSEITDYEIVEAMLMYGGGFVFGLGELFRRADAENQARLKAAFPEYFAKYREIAEQTKQRQAARDGAR